MNALDLPPRAQHQLAKIRRNAWRLLKNLLEDAQNSSLVYIEAMPEFDNTSGEIAVKFPLIIAAALHDIYLPLFLYPSGDIKDYQRRYHQAYALAMLHYPQHLSANPLHFEEGIVLQSQCLTPLEQLLELTIHELREPTVLNLRRERSLKMPYDPSNAADEIQQTQWEKLMYWRRQHMQQPAFMALAYNDNPKNPYSRQALSLIKRMQQSLLHQRLGC